MYVLELVLDNEYSCTKFLHINIKKGHFPLEVSIITLLGCLKKRIKKTNNFSKMNVFIPGYAKTEIS